MTATHQHKSTLLITMGGSLTGFCSAIQAEDMVRTCILAASGTLVSFFLTLFLKWIRSKLRK